MEDLDCSSKCVIVLIPLIASFSSFVMGYFITYLSMLESYFKIEHGFIQNQHQVFFTLAISALPVGGFIGALLYKKLLSTFYENKLLKMMNILAIVAILLQLITFHWPVLIISRFFMGFYCGIVSGLVPSYIMSISPSFTAGIIGSFHQTLIVLGIAFAYYMGQYKSNSTYSNQTTARIVIGFPLISIFVNLICLFLFPYNNIERYLKKKGQKSIVKRYLRTIYGKNWRKFKNQIRLFKAIPIENNVSKNKAQFSSEELENKDRLNPQEYPKKKFSWLGFVLAATSQLSGHDAILQYIQQLFNIFQNGNQIKVDQRIMFLGLFQFIVTLGSGFLINKIGRRPMMLIGMAIVLVALLSGFLITFLIDEHQSYTVWIIFLHILGYSMSIGPLCFIYAVEILSNIKIVLITFWGFSIITSLGFDLLIESQDGIPLMFFIYFVGSSLCFIFLYKKMIETKDVPKKKIYEMIEEKQIQWLVEDVVVNMQNKSSQPNGTNNRLLSRDQIKILEQIKKKQVNSSNTVVAMNIDIALDGNIAQRLPASFNEPINLNIYSTDTQQYLKRDYI